MRVRSVLEAKGRQVVTVRPDDTLTTALVLLEENRVGAVVVTTTHHEVVGIMSERDIVSALARHGVRCLSENVSTHMSTQVRTCTEDSTCDELALLMTTERFRHVPVMNSSELVGIISIGDVVKVRLNELEKDRHDLLEYVNAR